MPPIVLKLKGKKMFSVIVYVLRQTLCRLAPACPFPSHCDVAQARSFFAITVDVVYTGWSNSHTTHIKIFDGCNSVQFDWINKHTILLWLYKSSWRSHQSVSCLQTVEVQGCLFHKCNECSLLNTTWHLVLT
jgi:hypothetical protein